MRSSLFEMTVAVVGLIAVSGVSALSQDMPARAANQSWCQEDRGWSGHERVCEVREATVPARGTVTVDSSPNGGIEVVGWDRADVRIEARLEASADDAARARKLLEAVRVTTAGTIGATGPRSEDGNDHEWWSVSFRISVPRHSDLELHSFNGGIQIDGVSGKLGFRTVNGGVHLARVAGDVRGRTTNGGVHLDLDGIGWEGAGADIATTNGGVHVSAPSGYDAHLEVETVNGSVKGVKVDSDDERRGHHRQHVELDLGRGGAPVRLTTTNGGVTINTR